ncbi:MAG: hypothetical protein AAF627_02845 [Myxococcota bacterium]
MQIFELDEAKDAVTFRTSLRWPERALSDEHAHRWLLRRQDDGLFGRVEAPYHGDPAPSDREVTCLWEFEVAELFLGGADGRYTELELSPHGLHLLLAFSAPRVRSTAAPEEALQELVTARSQDRWSAHFLLPWAWVPLDWDRACSFGLHGRGEQRQYLLAAPMPGEHPDFHQPAYFPRLPCAFDPR